MAAAHPVLDHAHRLELATAAPTALAPSMPRNHRCGSAALREPRVQHLEALVPNLGSLPRKHPDHHLGWPTRPDSLATIGGYGLGAALPVPLKVGSKDGRQSMGPRAECWFARRKARARRASSIAAVRGGIAVRARPHSAAPAAQQRPPFRWAKRPLPLR